MKNRNSKNLPTDFQIHTKTCAVKDCTNSALWYPVVKVWAEGYPKSSPPLECEVGLTFCEEHKNKFTLESIPCLEHICASACRAYSKRDPDFKTAEIQMKPLIVG